MAKPRDPQCSGCGKQIPIMTFLDYTRDRAEKIFEHAGNHPKLKRANKLIEEARGIEDEVRELRSKHRKSLVAVYRVEVKVEVSNGTWYTKVPKGDEFIVITRYLMNQEVFDRHMKRYGSISNRPREKEMSVKYYRKHGLLLCDGGGSGFLEDEQPCSDEEWADMKAGGIPEKFLRG